MSLESGSEVSPSQIEFPENDESVKESSEDISVQSSKTEDDIIFTDYYDAHHGTLDLSNKTFNSKVKINNL
jgi:superfamily I DNA and RNA helicase